MKALLAALLVSPALAAAYPILTFTGGSITFGGNTTTAYFTFTGDGFSATGQVGEVIMFPNGFQFPRMVKPGLWNPAIVIDTEASLQMSLTYQGVTLLTGNNGNGAGWLLGTPGPGPYLTHEFDITGPGMYSEFFTSNGEFVGTPIGQPKAPAQTYILTGRGVVTIDVTPNPSVSGGLLVTQETFAFNAPEPSSLSLLLAGFGGLLILGPRRKSPAMLPVP